MIYTDELEPLAGGAEDGSPAACGDAVLHLPEAAGRRDPLYYYRFCPWRRSPGCWGWPREQVKSRLGRGRQRLQEQLQGRRTKCEPVG